MIIYPFRKSQSTFKMVDIFEQIVTRVERSMHVFLLWSRDRLRMKEHWIGSVCKPYEQIFNNVRR